MSQTHIANGPKHNKKYEYASVYVHFCIGDLLEYPKWIDLNMSIDLFHKKTEDW